MENKTIKCTIGQGMTWKVKLDGLAGRNVVLLEENGERGGSNGERCSIQSLGGKL